MWAVLAQSGSPKASSTHLAKSSKVWMVDSPLITASISLCAQIYAELPVMKDLAYKIFVHSSGKDPGWIAMASLIALMNPSVSIQSPLNFSGFAAFIGQIEEEVVGGAGVIIYWVAWTAAPEVALTRLFCVLMKWFWSS